MVSFSLALHVRSFSKIFAFYSFSFVRCEIKISQRRHSSISNFAHLVQLFSLIQSKPSLLHDSPILSHIAGISRLRPMHQSLNYVRPAEYSCLINSLLSSSTIELGQIDSYI